MEKTALVLGAGGFIGSHLVSRLKKEGYWVRGVDLKYPQFEKTSADDFVLGDLRDSRFAEAVFRLETYGVGFLEYALLPRPFIQTKNFDLVFQLAADMGGAGFVFTGDNDTEIMMNSAAININTLRGCKTYPPGKIFYSSSACMYPLHNQLNSIPITSEESAYPANPDSEYGWEKLFSERLYLAFARNYGLDVKVARFHNIYGPNGTYEGGREKAPAALCRKVSLAKDGDSIEVWGTGFQLRSFLYIDDCIDAVLKFVFTEGFSGPVNIGSNQMITINALAQLAIDISGKNLYIKNIEGPIGVIGRNSDNTLFEKEIGTLEDRGIEIGLRKTYKWIDGCIN